MVDLSALQALTKIKKKGFAEQKRFIANVLAGKQTDCPICHQELMISFEELSTASTIQCAKKCTDIALEID